MGMRRGYQGEEKSEEIGARPKGREENGRRRAEETGAKQTAY